MRTLLTLLLFLISIISYAQDQKKEKSFLKDGERWTLEVPIWIPGFKGDLAYGDISLEGEDGEIPIIPDAPGQLPEEGSGNIFSRLFSTNSTLRFFFIFRGSYQSDKFLAQADGLGGSLGTSIKFNYNDKEIVESAINLTLSRFWAGYEFLEKRTDSNKVRMQLHGYLGTRMYILKIHSSLNDPLLNLNVDQVWFDPIIGLQFQTDLKHWQFVFVTDIGGFYIDDRISYQNQLTAYYRISKLISIRGGWSDVNINYKSVILGKGFKWNAHLSGPSFGIGFHF